MNLVINGRFVTQRFSGVQRFASEISSALESYDNTYKLVAPSGGCANWPTVREAGRWQGTSWEQLDLPRAVHGGFLVNLGNTGPLLCRKQLVVIHDAGVFSTPSAYSYRFRMWYAFLQSSLIRMGAKIVTVSEFSRREILRFLSARPSQVEVMPEGADHMHRIDATPEILAEHGLEAKRFVLAVGNLAYHKNLAALGVLARQMEERGLRLVIAGGVGGTAFQRACLPHPAYYVGRISDGELKGLYENAACFVFPSLYEGYGLPPLEAMACGCPVIAADIPVLRELYQGVAWFCDPSSPEDIAAKVLRVLDSVALQEDLRAAGLEHSAFQRWDRAALELDRIVKDTLRYA